MNFPQFVVIHRVKGFCIVNEADVFLELACFLCDPMNVDSLIFDSSSFSKPSLYIWKFSVHVAWRILSITCEMSAIVQYFEHSLELPFFGIGMKTNIFQSSVHCWVSQICWHIEYSTWTASSFRIWNSLAGTPSAPLALFEVMLPKAHLTLHPGCLALSEWSHHRGYPCH